MLAACGALLMAALALGGCTNSKSADAQSTQTSAGTQTTVSNSPSAATSVATQTCAACTTKVMPTMVVGTVKDTGGTQVIEIGVKDGYYYPNQFTVKAGSPVKIVFTGKVAGCLGKPKFTSLNKQADFRETGTATLEIGTLAAGTYEFTCGMGMLGGKLIVQ